MFSDKPSEADSLSLLGVLKERERNAEKRKLLDKDFSDVLLVFDYDPQDNRFSPERLEEMAQYFNESTDEGKLYINYPMLESCKHFRRMPDLAFLTREVELADIPHYKELVGREACYQSYERDFNKTLLDLIVLLHIAKACHLCGLTFDPCACRGSYDKIDLENLLRCQNERYRSQAPIPVLATCLFFICDYSFGLIDHETATRALWEMG